MSTAKAVLDGTKMTNEQLGELTRRLDEIKRRINQGTLDYRWVIIEEQRLVEQGPPMLIFGNAVSIALTRVPFVIHDNLVKNMNANALVKISFIEGTFAFGFLGRVEEPLLGGSELLYGHPSADESFPGQIIAGLGGLAKAETTLTEMFTLMTAQGNGEKGPLLVDGNSNIFFVRDRSDTIREVSLAWINEGWGLFVHSVKARLLGRHIQVFFRNPHLAMAA